MNGSIAGIFRAASGGVVGGASSLSTPGSIVYVASAGVLGQDTSYSRSAAGRYTLYDSTPTTGVTTLTVRAGAGQGSTRILDVIAPSYGVKVTASGEFVLYDVGGNDRLYFHPTIFALGSTTAMAWASDTSVYSAKDLGLARASAGLLKVTDGSTGLGGIAIASQTPASASATGTQGQIAWDADYIYVCTATNTWKRVAIATWP